MWAHTLREEAVAETGAVSAATSQGCQSAATRSCRKRQEGSSPGASRGSTALLMLWFWTWGLQTVRERVSVALSHPVCSALLWKPQEAHLSIK